MTTTREPAVIVAGVVSVATAAVTLLVALGLDLDEDLQAAILGFVAVVVPLVAGLLIRPRVTPAVPDGAGEHRAP